ncbi:hypothetical protein Tco_0640399 [Tanacetum coccineum]
MNLLTGSMTPEQFQQEQQQAFFRWQQSQILNRDLDNLQQNPPSFHSESSQTLTQPQQVDSPKKGGRKKTKARRGKNVEDEPQEPVAAGRWLPVEEELLATCYVAVSEDNNVGSTGGSSRVRPNSGANGQGASLKRSRRKGFSRAQAEKRPHTNAVGGVESGFLDSGGMGSNHKKNVQVVYTWGDDGVHFKPRTSVFDSGMKSQEHEVIADDNVLANDNVKKGVVEQGLISTPTSFASLVVMRQKWIPNASLLKEYLCSIHVWVKVHDILIVPFTKDGLSVMATRLDLIDIRVDRKLKGTKVMLMPCLEEPLVNNSSNENKARKSNVQADEDSESDADDIYDETREFEAVKHSKS